MRQISAVVIGAGLRGREAYASYALDNPAELKIVAVVEPDEEKRVLFSSMHGINEERQYADYRTLLEQDKMADCVLVCTPDNEHYEPVMMALKKGYHVLCEKPMSKDVRELTEMAEMAKEHGKLLSICHVLRYSSFYMKIKELLEGGKIGTLQNIHQTESVGYWHYAHSFVRGAWRNAEESSPMILAKCCHDMDILLWLADSACKQIQSFGELAYFKKENAPEEAPDYCMDGCSNRDDCPYYAPRFYLTHPKAVSDRLLQAVSLDQSPQAVLEKLKAGPYGRCVFRCDNNVVDKQIVNIEFENGVKASLTMSAFTYDCRRDINLMGTKGQIKADMETGQIDYYDFVTGDKTSIYLNAPAEGHGGSDEQMIRNFVRLVAMDGGGGGRTTAAASIESHLMALAAECSRMENQVIKMKF